MRMYRCKPARALLTGALLLPLLAVSCDWDEKVDRRVEMACKAIDKWREETKKICLLIPPGAERTRCLRFLYVNYTRLSTLKIQAQIAALPDNCNEQVFKQSMLAIEATLKALIKANGINFTDWLRDVESVSMQAPASTNDGVSYALDPGAQAQVQTTLQGTPFNIDMQLAGNFSVDLQPNGGGLSGPVTGLEWTIEVVGPNPTTAQLTLAQGPDTASSFIDLQPAPGGFEGLMFVVVDVTNDWFGDPTWILTIPVHTPDPLVGLELGTGPVPVPGGVYMPTFLSTADPNADCNSNGIPDLEEIDQGLVEDCNGNGVPDLCDLADDEGIDDCNGNGVPDGCEMSHGLQFDTDADGLLEPDCEIVDCNNDGIPDHEQLEELDLNFNGFLDPCETDCNGNGRHDLLDIAFGFSQDVNQNEIPDECEGPLLGDMNCDGIVSSADIDPFVVALTDPAAYVVLYPDCDILNGDINGDGLVTAADIDPFVAILVGGN
jgi:hypothetical protein